MLSPVTTALAEGAPTARSGFAAWPTGEDASRAVVALGALLLVAAGVAAAAYWRERRVLGAVATAGLLAMRLVALASLALFALGPERRGATTDVRASLVALVVDASQSMGLPDTAPSGSGEGSPPQTRADAARRLLVESGLIDRLRDTHEVHLFSTDPLTRGLVFPQRGADEAAGGTPVAIPTDWGRPTLPDTRLGDALAVAFDRFAGRPLAGVVLLTDGRGNAGRDAPQAARSAPAAGGVVHVVGFGSPLPARNLAVSELVAPARAYAKDPIPVSAVVTAEGDWPAGEATLFARPEGAPEHESRRVATLPVPALASGASHTLRFEAPPGPPGAMSLEVHTAPRPGESDHQDNRRAIVVEVVDRLLRVLLVAGGPGRDFHFLRDQLHRDDAFEVDVLLQSASAGAAQDADHVLDQFPATEQALAPYDLLVAMDVDWGGTPAEATAAIERCVAQRGLGLVFIPGPVNTPRWVQRPDSATLAGLLPVRFSPQVALVGSLEAASAGPVRVELTRAGRDADFLQLGGTAAESAQLWEGLPGFYGLFPVASVNPGAETLASATVDGPEGAQRVWLAQQRYGAGWVVYLGAPEAWRLRVQSPELFTSFSTKLLQHAAEGRLLAQQPGGSLSFDRRVVDLGQTMTLRAASPEPLAGEPAAPDAVVARVTPPAGAPFSLTLRRQAEGRAAWVGRFDAQAEGVYRAAARLSPAAATIHARAEARVPHLERAESTRDAATLARIARAGGGHCYDTPDEALRGAQGRPPLAGAIPSRAETRVVIGPPDAGYAARVSRVLLTVICSCLLLEWAVRRLLRLA